MNTGKNFLHYLAQAIDQLARAIDQYRAERAASAEEAAPQVQPSQMHWLLRWLTPNGGTLLLVALLILTQNVWARRPAAPTTAISAVATTVNYQGHLADSNGNPLNDTVSLTFAIYDAETGGNVIWGPETHAAVDVQGGLFSVGLGTIQPLSADVWVGGDRYLEITVNGQTLSPREPIRSVPITQMAWTVPDGSITTDKIADGAVTSAKMSPTFFQATLNEDVTVPSGTHDSDHFVVLEMTVDFPVNATYLIMATVVSKCDTANRRVFARLVDENFEHIGNAVVHNSHPVSGIEGSQTGTILAVHDFSAGTHHIKLTAWSNDVTGYIRDGTTLIAIPFSGD